MDTKKYEAFEKTVELQSLTKAAQELGLTQSGVRILYRRNTWTLRWIITASLKP